MNRYFLLLIFLLFLSTSLSAQTQTLSIETGSGCAGQEVLLSVTSSNLGSVIAVLLYLDINPSSLTFISLENINPLLQGLIYNYIPDSNCLIVVWSSFAPVNLAQTPLFDIKTKVEATPGVITFLPGCEIADGFFNPIAISYINGTLEPANPIITAQPSNISVAAGDNAFFQITSENSSHYKWEFTADSGINWNTISDDERYMGSETNYLTIKNVFTTFNKNLFRCVLSRSGCPTTSSLAALYVDSLTAVNSLTNGSVVDMENHPNPFSESTMIEYSIPREGNIHIMIYSMLGNLVADLMNEINTRGQHTIPFYAHDLKKGIYLCQIEFATANFKSTSSFRMIKI